MGEIWGLLVLVVLPNLVFGVQVEQAHKLILVQAGNPVELRCHHDDISYYVMLWYQQKSGEGLKLMVYSTEENSKSDEREDGFKSWDFKRTDIRNSTLALSRVQAADSAVYFCAVSKLDSYTSAVYFGSGTTIAVMEKGREKRNPNVTIYLPNPQELLEHNRVSLVCVSSNFYPEQAFIRWKVNGKEREFIDQAKPIAVSDTFSVSRRLSLTKEEFYNPENVFRCESGFQDEENQVISKEIRGRTGCNNFNDKYRRFANNGKYSYTLILCKSALYGFIVSAVMLRKKMIRSSY